MSKSLGNTCFADANAIELAYALTELPNLENLNLGANLIRDAGLTSLSIVLAGNQTKIKNLNLCDNNFTSKGAIHLFRALEKTIHLKQLVLNINKLDVVDVKALAVALAKNKSLESLFIGKCNLDDHSASIIANALSMNKTLKTLQLWGNKITDEGARALMEVLENYNSTITCIDLDDNPISDEVLEDINDLVKQNNDIQKEYEDMPKKYQKSQQPSENTAEEEEEDEKEIRKIECAILEEEQQAKAASLAQEDTGDFERLESAKQTHPEVEVNDGKTLKWVGMQGDSRDGFLHSKLEPQA
eukprot:TRINITY_DN2706_c0_g3_i4.p1 TRINITY_DN2706_c0_g3~~TRINITY_DN2706_c0_g3_i4.p1  ORF type:complete len:301 (-),score=90.55 TRINITY_DN2706_c0_g3_i4:98-1000(-)